MIVYLPKPTWNKTFNNFRQSKRINRMNNIESCLFALYVIVILAAKIRVQIIPLKLFKSSSLAVFYTLIKDFFN